jgi:protein-tyrosine phosphatase
LRRGDFASSDMTRHVLVVCTANVCRSPVVAALLSRVFAGTQDVDGETWVATSAGTGQYTAPLDRNTIAAAADIGIDVSTHRPRALDRQMLGADGAELVLTMARAHLPAVTGLDPSAWPRTFTLKELARRAVASDPPERDEGFIGWRTRMADGRSAAAMLSPDPADDVADPYGLPLPEHVAMIAEVAAAIDQLIRWGPWTPRADAAESATHE